MAEVKARNSSVLFISFVSKTGAKIVPQQVLNVKISHHGHSNSVLYISHFVDFIFNQIDRS